MSVKPPKAEVAIHEADVRYVPLTEVTMPVEEPSTASRADIGMHCKPLFPAPDLLAGISPAL